MAYVYYSLVMVTATILTLLIISILVSPQEDEGVPVIKGYVHFPIHNRKSSNAYELMWMMVCCS